MLGRYRPLLIALTLGTSGGALFAWIGTPIPWMLGSMVATTLAALLGVKIGVPRTLRLTMGVILGVLIGSTFSPDLLARVPGWSVSISAVALYTAMGMVASIVTLQMIARYDPVTAYFTAAPGSFAAMTLLGAAYGGDESKIALSHSIRILIVVSTVPALLLSGAVDHLSGPPSVAGRMPAWTDLAILAACGLGVFPARWLKIKAEYIIGPMVVSAAVHLAGVTDADPPRELVSAAQVVVGAFVGARFAGVDLRSVGRTIVLGAVITFQLILIAFVFAYALNLITGLPMIAMLLVFMPGGLSEMTLIALATGVEPALVATHHMARIFLISMLAPVIFKLYARWQAPEALEGQE